jgi:hypothetical protein
MPVLTPRKPVTLKEPLLLVENQLPPGRYRFELVVTDDGNNESDPTQLVVIVRDRPTRPTGPVIRPGILDRIDRGGPIPPEIIRPIRRPPR